MKSTWYCGPHRIFFQCLFGLLIAKTCANRKEWDVSQRCVIVFSSKNTLKVLRDEHHMVSNPKFSNRSIFLWEIFFHENSIFLHYFVLVTDGRAEEWSSAKIRFFSAAEIASVICQFQGEVLWQCTKCQKKLRLILIKHSQVQGWRYFKHVFH